MGLNEKPVRFLELYSGIGGIRCAMKFAGISYEIVAAVDVNPVVNDIYCQNFSNSHHFQRNILSFSAKEIEEMKLDIITMSPPCQPFTRVGLKKDVEDARTCSFLHILNLIQEIHHKPTYILLENVKGFEESLAHNALIETLQKCGYNFQEFLLSPSSLGFPNSRLRYYIIAKLKSSKCSFPSSNEILHELPENTINKWKAFCKKCSKEQALEECCIKHFLEEKPENYFDAYLVPDNVLLKYSKIFDIVYENSSQSCCFTKAYGRYSLGTGSVFTPCNSTEVSEVYQKIESVPDSSTALELLKSLTLRYFTPQEVANLMCFPSDFNKPSSVSDKQLYKAFGNSVNVFVVSRLLKLLFENE